MKYPSISRRPDERKLVHLLKIMIKLVVDVTNVTADKLLDPEQPQVKVNKKVSMKSPEFKNIAEKIFCRIVD
jgi:hypothetical protein